MQQLPISEKTHECECGHEHGLPELDGRVIPHAVRHGAIFGALSQLPVGGAMILIAPHDPLPLLDQLEQRAPGIFEITYLETGPDAWRLQFLRAGA